MTLPSPAKTGYIYYLPYQNAPNFMPQNDPYIPNPEAGYCVSKVRRKWLHSISGKVTSLIQIYKGLIKFYINSAGFNIKILSLRSVKYCQPKIVIKNRDKELS